MILDAVLAGPDLRCVWVGDWLLEMLDVERSGRPRDRLGRGHDWEAVPDSVVVRVMDCRHNPEETLVLRGRAGLQLGFCGRVVATAGAGGLSRCSMRAACERCATGLRFPGRQLLLPTISRAAVM